MKKFMIRKIPVVIIIAALGILVFSSIVMLLWNSILPVVLHVSAITLWQAAGILLLSKILFGGFRGRRGMGGGYLKKRIFWHSMTPEEKEKMQHFGGCYRQYGNKGGAPDTMNQPVV